VELTVENVNVPSVLGMLVLNARISGRAFFQSVTLVGENIALYGANVPLTLSLSLSINFVEAVPLILEVLEVRVFSCSIPEVTAGGKFT
jgi:hypothetical protein